MQTMFGIELSEDEQQSIYDLIPDEDSDTEELAGEDKADDQEDDLAG